MSEYNDNKISTSKKAIVGCLGDIPFHVNANCVQTFQNLSWKSSAKYSTHARHMKKELLELTGIEADEISFDMFLSAYLGVKPMTILKKLEKMMKKGTVVPLVIGSDIVGKSWVVSSINRAVKHTYKDGTMITCEVNVTLKEYT